LHGIVLARLWRVNSPSGRVERVENLGARLACVPNLRFDGLIIDGQRPGREFYTDGRLGVKVEFVASEP
jgi:hypothetical protein